MANKTREVVVVTGASAGVGRATARAFGERGAWVGLIARGRDRLEEAKREIEERGGRALVLPADVARQEEVEAAADAVERELGPIDVWVNCAMTSVFSPAHEMSGEEYRRVTEVNYLGYVFGTLAALRRMRQRNRGSIVQVSSSLGLRAIPLQSAYCATQGGDHPVHGGAALRAAPRRQPRAALAGPHAGVEHAAVRLGALAAAPPRPARAAHLPAGGGRARDRLGRAPSPPGGGGRWPDPRGDPRQQVDSGLLDRYLARKGYSAQQTEEPADPNRPDNLWEPVVGQFGAHGRFDERAARGAASCGPRSTVDRWRFSASRWPPVALTSPPASPAIEPRRHDRPVTARWIDRLRYRPEAVRALPTATLSGSFRFAFRPLCFGRATPGAADLDERPESAPQHLKAFKRAGSGRGDQIPELGEGGRRVGFRLEVARRLHGRRATLGQSLPDELSDHEILRTPLWMKPRFEDAHGSFESKRGAGPAPVMWPSPRIRSGRIWSVGDAPR